MRFCGECGKSLSGVDSKFCTGCGAKLTVDSDMPVRGDQASVGHEQITEVSDSQPGFEPFKPTSYQLGEGLEDAIAAILRCQGYSVEKRKRIKTQFGTSPEIDVYATKGNIRKAVECKNYDQSRKVGVSHLREFIQKMDEADIPTGIFVTFSDYSDEAFNLAAHHHIDLWNHADYIERVGAYLVSRIDDPSRVLDPILPLEMDFDAASSISFLRNDSAISLSKALLVYRPYLQVDFRLKVARKDPNGRTHKVDKSGTYVVDALGGEILNPQRTIFDSVGTLFKRREERLQSKESQMVVEDLHSKEPTTRFDSSGSGYELLVNKPIVTVNDASETVKSYVVETNKTKAPYHVKVKGGEYETRSMPIIPKASEVAIRSAGIVYVPRWILEFESAGMSYTRRYLASSGRVLEDDLAKCSMCTILRKPGVAVCEECGRLLCDKHAYQEGRWLCGDHISGAMREQIRDSGFFSRLTRKRE